jgi:hypothetical protein
MKKFLALVSVSILAYFISLGCSKPQPVPPPPTESETIIAAYVDNVDKKFILLGEKYQFIIGNSGRYSPRLEAESLDVLMYLLAQQNTRGIAWVIPTKRPIMMIQNLDNVMMVRFVVQIKKDEASQAVLSWVKEQVSAGVIRDGKAVALFEDAGEVFKKEILLDARQYKSDQVITAQVGRLIESIPIMIEKNSLEKQTSTLVFKEGNLTLRRHVLSKIETINYIIQGR